MNMDNNYDLPMYDKICPVCNKFFSTIRKNQIYCCENCKKKYYAEKKRVTVRKEHIELWKLCPVCKKNFQTSNIQKIYCCKECRSIAGKLAAHERWENAEYVRNRQRMRRGLKNKKTPLKKKKFSEGSNMNRIIEVMKKCQKAGYGHNYGLFVASEDFDK